MHIYKYTHTYVYIHIYVSLIIYILLIILLNYIIYVCVKLSTGTLDSEWPNMGVRH